MADCKYEYESESFSNACENYALKGLTDKEIAIELGLNVTYFCELKSKHDNISEALARGRSKIISAVRQKYIGVALGGLKRKTVTRKIPSRFDDESDIHPDGMVVLETTEEMAPNAQALATLLFNYDEEWRKKVIDGKKLDVTTNGKELNGSVSITSWLAANNTDDDNEAGEDSEEYDDEEEDN